MSSESTIFNNDEILLPPKTNKKKTLVLDLDETLVHSQFMAFSDPSDVVIQIELENELHDIHVMVRPGVKEFLEKMSKLYEIVIFTASVSKYADPLLNIIDKKGYCPHRLFREHCSLINTTFVKDLQRLGRDIKNIIIVDNSPISYALHPENGLPILTWFEDKTDRELYKITTILQFLSSVSDVRDFIPKFVDNNTINYEKANEIIKNYNGQRQIFRENRYSNNSNRTSYDGKGINIQIVNSNNSKSNMTQNRDKKAYNKDNNGNHKDKLVELAMKNIITSVSPMTVIPINNNNNNSSLIRSQRNSKNKIVINNQRKGANEEQKNNKEKNYIKIDPKNRIMNIKNLSINNGTQSTKKNIKSSRPLVTDDTFKFNKHIRKYSLNENQLKNGLSKLSSSINKSIMLNTNVSNNYSNYVKSKNNLTPKSNKTINLLNKSNHMTRSVKYSKKTNTTYIVNSTPNIPVNKLSKSLTKSTFNTKDSKLNKESKFSKYNNIYKTLNVNGNGNNYNGLPNHKKQKSYNDFRAFEIKKFQFKNSVDKTDKYIKKNDFKKSKIFFKQGINHHKYIHSKINNINTNSSNNIRFSNQSNFSNNTSDYMRTNRSNIIKPVLTSSNLLRSSNITRNYSPHSRDFRKSLDLNINTNKSQYIKFKNNKNNNSAINEKLIDYKNKNNQKKMLNYNYDNNMKIEYKKLKLARPKSSNLNKLENRISNAKTQFEKNGNKYLNYNKSDISSILKKKEIYGNNK